MPCSSTDCTIDHTDRMLRVRVGPAVVVEAGRLGIEARRFMTEEDAARWLAA